MRLPLTAAERIDEICDRFEAAWKAGEQPRVEDYLDGAASDERDSLWHELRRVEAHYRPGTQAVAGSATTQRRAGPSVAGYEILGELGRGGMGIVYKARQLRPNRLVALKMISSGPHAPERALQRFLREADAVAHLQHPNIVQVYEVGEQDGRPYFALEYVAGGSLDQRLKGAPLPPRTAAELVERLAHAIHHAHERGIIHRDLKPANILLFHPESPMSKNGEPSGAAGPVAGDIGLGTPKITDFGLAKLRDIGAGNPTGSGDLLGTPSYMAPEQISGRVAEISPGTDVYGLGAILYELLTGRAPFRGESALHTMIQVQLDEPVSPSRLTPNCPRDVVTICLKCLHKQPRQRYASALELAEDLRRFLDNRPIRARPVGRLTQALKWARRQPVIAGLSTLLLLAVTLGAAAGGWFWWRAEEGRLTADAALLKEQAAQAARMATLGRYQIALAHREWLANDASRAAALLDACTGERRQTWEWRYLDRMRSSALATFAGHSNTVQALAIHPLGKQFASASHDQSVRSWDLATAIGKPLFSHKSLVMAVAYSPDGRLLASSDLHDGTIKIWDTRGGPQRELVYSERGEAQVTALAFAKDSRYLAAGGSQGAKIYDTQSEEWVYEVPANENVSQVAFSPNGQYLATASRRVKVWDWSARASEPLRNWSGHGIHTYDLAFNREGNLVVSGGRDGLVRVRSLRTIQEEFTLNAHPLSVTSVCFSPDGGRLASAGLEGDMHVWDVKARRKLLTLHGHSGPVWDLAYLPDGSRLLSAGGDFLIRMWDATESQEYSKLPFRISNQVTALAYGPHGRLLAWGDLAGRVGVWDTVERRIVFRSDDPGRSGRNPIAALTFRPDGRQLAWRPVDGTPRLGDLVREEEIPLDTAEHVKFLGLAFSADGHRLLAAHWEKEQLHLRDLFTGRSALTLPWPENRITQFAWSPDMASFVTVEDRRYARLWDMQTGRPLGETLEHQPPVRHVAFSHNGRYLAMGGIAGRMSVWDVATGNRTMAVTGHSLNLWGLALSPDGSRLASTAADCTAKLWNTETGHDVLTLRTRLHEFSPLAFNPDGTELVGVSADNHLLIWKAPLPEGSPDAE